MLLRFVALRTLVCLLASLVMGYCVFRPISNSPTVFSLARRQLSLTEKSKSDLLCPGASIPQTPGCRFTPPLVWSCVFGPTYFDYFLLNFMAHACSTRSCNKACLLVCSLQLNRRPIDRESNTLATTLPSHHKTWSQ